RNPDSVVPEADDVQLTIAGHVSEKARMLFNAPSAGIIGEVRHNHGWRLEGSVAVIARDPDSVIAEDDDVQLYVAGHVGEKAKMSLNPPSTLVVTKVRNAQLRFLTYSVPVSARNPDSVVPEADDVQLAVAGHIGEETRMLFNAPSTGVIAEVS